jgi:hypothetical protein
MDLSALLHSSVHELSQFLRQKSRSLKQLSLQALDALLCAPSTRLDENICIAVMQESAALLAESDLHLADLTLKLLHSVLRKSIENNQVRRIFFLLPFFSLIK